MSLLDHLNPEQLAAVTLPNQHALILAGAGSGKTRVLTTRIAWLVQTGSVSPAGVLAVTFTNKAAREMLTRISAMLPINTRGMWVGTFHGLCNRMLRAHYRDAGLPQLFQILDTQDQLAVVKRVLKSMNVDEEKFQPKQVQWFINGAKEEGRRAADVEAYDDFSRRTVELYAAYDEQCQKEGLVDFPELLLRCFELLSRNEVLRSHYQSRFRHILVDEFQDTNRLQYRWLKLLAGQGNAIFAVGDDDQCVVEGTRITMADGSTKPVEKVKVGDEVLSCHGHGSLRAAEVTGVFRRKARGELLTIVTRSGKRLTTTPEHTHFADFVLGTTPQRYFTYLMHKRGFGYRLGTSQVYTNGQERPMLGFRQRALQEHADAVWIVGAHDSESAARMQETVLSLRYALPTLPFVPRKGGSVNGLVHDGEMIRKVFRAFDTEASARRLMDEVGLDPDEPHHLPRSRDSNRRNIVLTLCADKRGHAPMHRVAIGGNDAEGRATLEGLGLSVRPAKRSSRGWRFETVFKDYGRAAAVAQRAATAIKGRVIQRAAFAPRALPYLQARSVRPGMAVVGQDGELDVVDRVERRSGEGRTVYDLNVAGAHNFVANGIVTHNSIYRFRGANVGNMADFEREFKVENLIRLEQNYRSHGNILNAANALISHNRRRLGKSLWTAAGEGEPVRVYEAQSDGYEAHWISEEVQALIREGYARSDIAVLYRSNAQSRVIEHALFTAGLPYRVYGGLRFFERQEVKHALAYLRLIANPDDDSAFLRVVNFPTRGIGARSVEQVQDAARAAGGSLWQAAAALTGKAGTAVGTFVKLVAAMRENTKGLPLPEVVDHVLHASGLLDHYKAEREGADRIENLEELVNAATAFVRDELPSGAALAAVDQSEGASAPDAPAEPTDPWLAAFLAHAALESGENQAGEGIEAVQLMTAHSAKGLEFHIVFVSGLEEGLFPHEQSVAEEDGLEEERRLMYVAVTRARTRLYLSFAQTRLLHGQTRYNVASRFLDEVPAEVLKWLTPRGGKLFDAAAWAPAPPPARLAAKAERTGGPGALPFKIGQNVNHPKFGTGVIVSAEGSGEETRVQINFGKQGMKLLQLKYAKLTPA